MEGELDDRSEGECGDWMMVLPPEDDEDCCCCCWGEWVWSCDDEFGDEWIGDPDSGIYSS